MKRPAADPVSTALTLLEQALAGAMVGLAATPSVSGAPLAAPSAASTQNAGPASAPGSSAGATLSALLAPNLPSDPKAHAAGPALADPTPAAAAPAATASTAAAALAATAQLASGPHVAAQPGASASTPTLASQVGTSAWTDELGARLTWMAQQGIQSASLRLTPEHLGPLQVTISVHDGQASVWFGAAQPDTRTALQQSLPQLRQMFAGQGLTLADAGVSREPPRQSQQQPVRAGSSVAGVGAIALDAAGGHASIAGGAGLVDTYA